MRKVRENIKLSVLLVGKLLGTLTKEQDQKLQEWEKEEANQQLEKEIFDARSFEIWNERMDRMNPSEEWDHFVDFMEQEERKRKVIKMRFYKTTVSIAAAVFVIGLGIFTYYQNNLVSSPATVLTTTIAPGTSNAKLILADGKEVNLGTSKNDKIVQSNVTLANAKGVLQYNNGLEHKSVPSVVNTLVTPRGGEYQLVLSDGTKVWLNSDSQLTYSVPFSDKNRTVHLKGEAYFEVAHDKTKPFIVETDKQQVQVLGTHFNVSAYSNDLNVVTTLVEGKVRVDQAINKSAEILLPNEQLILNKQTHNTLKQKVDTYLYTAWKEGRFVFKNEPLESFFEKLSRWYNVDVVIVDESLKKINFSGDLPRNKNLIDIMNIVEGEMSVHVKIKSNKVIYVTK